MKRQHWKLAALLLLGSTSALGATAYVESLNSISDLVATTTTNVDVFIAGYRTDNDGGQGIFTWKPGMPSTNTGTVFAAAGGGMWVRQYSGPLNVKWFGAWGNGASNDTTYVSSALTTAAGSSLLFPNGQYLLNSQFQIPSNSRLIGEAGATLQMANSQNSSFLITPSGGGTNITLHGLTIDGNKANNTAGSAIVFGGKNITIDGCVVKNTAEAGILLAPTSDHTAGNNAVRNCYILNPSLASNNWGGIGITGSAGALVRGNTIESTEGYMTYGIAVEPDNGTATNEITKIVISDNIIKGGRLFVDGGNLSSPLPLVTVQNNIVDARGSKGNSYDNDAPLYCRKVRGLVVQGNTTRDNLSSTSPFRAAVLEGISDFAFVSNVHYATTNSTAGLTRRAVYFSNTTTSSDGLVANNVIVSEQGQCEYGIYAYNGGSPLAITNVDYFNNKIVNFTTPTLP